MSKPAGCKCSNGDDPDLHFYGCPYFAPPEADPQMQAENMDYMKILAIVMWKHGWKELIINSDEIASMPQDQVLVMGPHPDNKTMRFRLMPYDEAVKEREQLGER